MKAEMKQEMVAEAMDMGTDQTEADDVYNQILGEIGVDVDMGAQVGTSAIGSNKQMVQEEAKDSELDDMEKRLAALQ